MVTKVSTEGQIVLPAELREQDKIVAGQEFEIERVHEGEYRLKRKLSRPNVGLVDLLLSCPVKDWFVPFDSTEKPDDVRIPTFE